MNTPLTATIRFLQTLHLKDCLRDSTHLQEPLNAPRKPLDIVKFTTNTTINEALKDQLGSSIYLSPYPSLLQALAASNILSAPVSDAITKEYVGIIDVMDILGGFLHSLYPELLTETYVVSHKRHSMNELQTLGADFGAQPIAPLLHGGDLWYKGDAGSTLLEIVESGFRVGIAPSSHPPQSHSTHPPTTETAHSLHHRYMRVHHRVAIFDILPGELTPDGPIPEWRIVDIISQMDVLRFIAHHMDDLVSKDPGMMMSIQDLGGFLVQGHVMSVDVNVPAIHALALMYKNKLSALAVVHDDEEEGEGKEREGEEEKQIKEGEQEDPHHRSIRPATLALNIKSSTTTKKTSLLANISASDIRGISTRYFGALALPVGAFILMMHPHSSFSMENFYVNALLDQFPEDIQQGHWKKAFSEAMPMVCCTPAATLKDVILMMVESGKHRVYVCGENDHDVVVGVITPTDILRRIVVGS